MQSSNDNKWELICKFYPDTDNYRGLKDDLIQCRFLFEKILKNTDFNIVLNGLKNEKYIREEAKGNGIFFPEWKSLYNWLIDRKWEVFQKRPNIFSRDI